jgi:prevent-host-death family protein
LDKRFSIAQAKDHFCAIIESAERGTIVTVTRRGGPVARVISEAKYEKLIARRRKMAWSAPVHDTRGFRFDREQANRR